MKSWRRWSKRKEVYKSSWGGRAALSRSSKTSWAEPRETVRRCKDSSRRWWILSTTCSTSAPKMAVGSLQSNWCLRFRTLSPVRRTVLQAKGSVSICPVLCLRPNTYRTFTPSSLATLCQCESALLLIIVRIIVRVVRHQLWSYWSIWSRTSRVHWLYVYVPVEQST